MSNPRECCQAIGQGLLERSAADGRAMLQGPFKLGLFGSSYDVRFARSSPQATANCFLLKGMCRRSCSTLLGPTWQPGRSAPFLCRAFCINLEKGTRSIEARSTRPYDSSAADPNACRSRALHVRLKKTEVRTTVSPQSKGSESICGWSLR